MAGSPRTSFVIATRNRADDLERTVQQLLDSTQCPIIVVDNASQDATREAASALTCWSRRIRLITLDRDRGAIARNVGVYACRTPYVAFCDDDSWWQPEAIAIGEAEFGCRPALALLAARTVVLPGGHTDAFSEQLAASPLGCPAGLPGPSVLGFQTRSAMVRKRAFEGVGGFSPVPHFRGEEQLLALDLAAAGWQLCYCPAMVACHQPSLGRGAASAQHARVLRNDALTAWMRRPASVCAVAAGALLRAAVHDGAHFRAATEALLRLPAAVRQRRALPSALEAQVRLCEAPPKSPPDAARRRPGDV